MNYPTSFSQHRAGRCDKLTVLVCARRTKFSTMLSTSRQSEAHRYLAAMIYQQRQQLCADRLTANTTHGLSRQGINISSSVDPMLLKITYDFDEDLFIRDLRNRTLADGCKSIISSDQHFGCKEGRTKVSRFLKAATVAVRWAQDTCYRSHTL